MKGSTALVIIGVDPHKRTHTASVVETGTDKVLATLQIDASLAGYRRLLKWASGFEQRRWAVENARGLGRHLAQWLVAREEVVDDVPSTATARVRELSRGGRRKNDAAYSSRRRRGANREAVNRPSGCRKGLRAPAPHQPLCYPERVGANDEGHGASR
jgi:transposase